MDRLRAGEVPTAHDVDRARASAEAQLVESELAEQRLAAARISAAERRRRDTALLGIQAGGRLQPSDYPMVGTRLETARYQRLRDAFVALGLQSVPEEDLAADERRRHLLRSVVDRATDRPPISWPAALCAVAGRLPGVRGAAMTIYDRSGVPHPLSAADDWSRQAEEFQQLLGEGPGLTAHRTRRPVVVTRLTSESGRWPGYVAAATGVGVDVLWALPIPLGASSLGSVTLYRDDRRPGGLAWQDACTVAVLAASAVIVDLEENDRGMISHSDPYRVVDVAAGVLSVQLGVPVEQALARIRAHAFGTGSRISDVAQAILEHRLRLC
jgi:hypothetical protein